MARLSHSEFREELDRLSNSPGAIPHTVQDGGTIAPTSRIPPATNPSTRRSARSRPQNGDTLGLVGTAIDAVCIPYSFAPRTVSNFLNRVPVNAAANAIWPNAVDNVLQRACGASPEYVQPTPSFPFSGGQCDGVLYRVTATLGRYGGGCERGSDSVNSDTFWGPILNTRLVPDGPSSEPERTQRVEVFCRGEGQNAIGSLGWFGVGAASNFVGGCPPPFLVSVTVVPDDGSPDACGDPPPQYTDGTNIDFAPVIDVDIAPNIPISISPDFTVNVDGSINIELPGIGDVTIDIGGVDINFPGGGSDGGNDGGSGSPRPDPGDTGTDPDSPPPPPPVGDDPATEEPEEEPDRVIRAVLVTVTSLPSEMGRLYQGENPDIILPNLGYINFRVRADSGASGWTPDQAVKNLRTFIPCEWSGGAFAVEGTPRPGVSWELTPIYDFALATVGGL